MSAATFGRIHVYAATWHFGQREILCQFTLRTYLTTRELSLKTQYLVPVLLLDRHNRQPASFTRQNHVLQAFLRLDFRQSDVA